LKSGKQELKQSIADTPHRYGEGIPVWWGLRPLFWKENRVVLVQQV